MAVFKCKMCGGALEVTEGMTVCECEYCGSQQTLPKNHDEVLTNLFNRANNLRSKSEFDKAQEFYEKIVAQNPTEAEAYWGIILCKYGIEYVEDPATLKRIPTCHRTQLESVKTDTDYQSALENADAVQRTVYEREAAEIDRLQRDILEIVHKEKPFDVFICYKETDENGKRTQDSVIANDIYHQLTQEGFKVFYAAITLEDKLGQAYEPYIFAALNSAKVMLVLGTKPEYFNAVWVRNEWSRYLKIVRNDRSKLLIPCYRDMDAYDLPDEFSHLQAQDMSKIGFINDVIRGIRKVLTKETPAPAVVRETVVQAANAAVAPLLKRAALFLEDREWSSAQDYCEKVLDQEPENAQAYLYKLMAELQVSKQEDLPNCLEAFDRRDNYKKAIRFGDAALVEMLNRYITHINNRNEYTRLNQLYQNAKRIMTNAGSSEEYFRAEKAFQEIKGFQDADELAEECLQKGRAEREKSIYRLANSALRTDTIESVEEGIDQLKSIPNYKDAAELLQAAQTRLEELKVEKAAEDAEAEKQRIIDAKKHKRSILIRVISVVIVTGLVITVIIKYPAFATLSRYHAAVEMLKNGQYEDAKAIFVDLGEYKDAPDLVKEADYQMALDSMQLQDYAAARSGFEKLEGYKDSSDQLLEATYLRAIECMNSKQYANAKYYFELLGDFKDSTDQLLEAKYQCALVSIDNKNYANAEKEFESLGNYKDSVILKKECELNGVIIKADYSLVNKQTNKPVSSIKATNRSAYSCNILINVYKKGYDSEVLDTDTKTGIKIKYVLKDSKYEDVIWDYSEELQDGYGNDSTIVIDFSDSKFIGLNTTGKLWIYVYNELGKEIEGRWISID